jgi:diacylglycerol kinase (ATP)
LGTNQAPHNFRNTWIIAKRVLLVINSRARRGADARASAVAALESRGHSVLQEHPESSAEVSAAISRRHGEVDTVVVGGGDGTLIAAIDGVRQLAAPLVIIPLGTINELSRTLGLPFDIPAACALVDDGRARPIDIGCANGVWFFNEASIGLSTHVAREQTGNLKSRWGMLAIPIGTIRALRHLRPYRLTAKWDGGERIFRTVQLTVANSYRFGGIVENPDAAIDDGALDLYSIDIRRPWDALDVMAAVARKQFPASRNVWTVRATSFTVTSRHPHHVFADGEPAGSTPAEFTIVPRALQVLVPQ